MMDTDFPPDTSIFEPLFNSADSEYNSLEPWTLNNEDYFKMPNINSWQTKPLLQWNTDDRLNWMCEEACLKHRDYEALKLENFVKLSTETFWNMNKEEFVTLCESVEDGQFLYTSKENFIKQHTGSVVNQCETTQQENPGVARNGAKSSSASSNAEKRGRGRPHKCNTLKKKPEKSTGKLWEFLKKILQSKDTCPRLIIWDDYNEGKFKFVQSEEVAKLWGSRKNNANMNYEKFSRAIRYYYKSEVLLPVTGKRLVYQFGPQATGWRTDYPILDKC